MVSGMGHSIALTYQTPPLDRIDACCPPAISLASVVMGSKKKVKAADIPARTPSHLQDDADRLYRLQVQRVAVDAGTAVEAVGRKRQASRTLSGLSPGRPTSYQHRHSL